jgi:rhodanese-related sulfurtransferase
MKTRNSAAPDSTARNRITNLIIVALALFLATALAKEYFYASKPGIKSQAKGRSLVGSRLSVAGVDLQDVEQTLLLALDEHCPYSRQSMPFYKQLAEHAAGREDVRLIGAVETGAESGQKYVGENGVRVDVIKWDFRRQGILQTPNLLLVNRTGDVTKQWTGRLSTAGEAEVISELFGKPEAAGGAVNPNPAPAPSAYREGGPHAIGVRDLVSLLKEERVTLLDLDDRESYAAEHIEHAKNIPSDELYIRALNELDRGSTIVLYTRNYNRLFLGNVQVLKRQGFDKVKVLEGGLSGWKGAGLAVSTARSAG